jgi:uncharacterized protein
MSREVVSGIKRLVDGRAPELKKLHFSWFGGEPFIAYDIVHDLMEHANAAARKHGVMFTAAATTNAYNLTEERFVEMDRLGMQTYQVSLDGDADAHDTTRLRIDGVGTFERIWKNVELFNVLHMAGTVKHGRMLLRLHVHRNNAGSMHRLAERIKSTLRPSAFTIHVKNVGKYGQDDSGLGLFDNGDAELGAICQSIYGELADFTAAFGNEVQVCYACRPNSLAVRSDGTLGKCTVALSSSKNNLGRINPDGTLDIDGEKLRLWMSPLESMEIDALGCPVSHLHKYASRALAAV